MTGELQSRSGLTGVHAGIHAYYSGTIKKYGATPLGVDWSCVPTQELRFLKLLRLCDFGAPFSLNDIGCGYGALLDFLERQHSGMLVDYLGIDLVPAMIRHACRLHRAPGRFIRGHTIPRVADYCVASGIFNVQLEQPLRVWEALIASTLDQMHQASTRGFAVNFMRAPPTGRPVRRGLYVTEPKRWSQYCTEHLRIRTRVIEGYGMPEFTLLARRRIRAS